MSAVPAFLLRVAQAASPAFVGAPGVATGAARAALAPRFAAPRAMQSVAAPDFLQAHAADAQDFSAPSVPRVSAPLSTPSPASTEAAPQRAVASDSGDAARALPTAADVGLQAHLAAALSHLPAARNLPLANATPARASPHDAQPLMPIDAARNASRTASKKESIDGDTNAAPPGPFPAPSPLHIQPARAAPLRPATVAQHAATTRTAAAPPVLHITIDRIDVRAPAVPAPGRAATKPRTPAAASLSDYLRQRNGAGS